MTCQFRKFAQILDLENVLKCLYADDSVSTEETEDDSWNWTVEDSSACKNNENWLNECFVSLSPTSEILAFAKNRNLVVLKGKWNSNEESEIKIKYSIIWNGDITESFSERISAILCLPVAGQGKLSANCSADWTAIAVGFNSGSLRFYTEKGGVLLSELLHDEPVTSLKFQSYQPNCTNSLAQVDELHVTFGKVVCCVQGFALCNTLKACRNQLARVQANCADRVEAPPLDHIKWSLPEQEVISDVCVLGSSSSTMFGHLATASLRGGYNAVYRSGPPQLSTVLAAGTSPYFAWHSIVEGTSGPVLSDVAKAVASKLKSTIGNAIPTWLVGSRKISEEKIKEKPPIEPPEVMACRYGLCDKLRKGEKVYISPQKNLCVVCDALGRVVLIDNTSGLALRMWKGYRDAQCCFISVDEDENVLGCRKAQFLVIFAPKKGLLEVHGLQQGPKIATFQSSKHGRLLYIKYGLMGANSVSLKTSNISRHPSVFIDNNGEMSEIVVPFHAILSAQNNVQSKDVHILKQLKKILSSKREISNKEFLDFCDQLTTDEIKFQVVEAAIFSKNIKPELMECILDNFMDRMESDENDEKDVDSKFFVACTNLQRLVRFYMMTMSLLNAPPEYKTVVPDSPADDEKELSKLLRLNENDIFKLFSMTESPKMSVTFDEERFPIFLKTFSNSYKDEPPIGFAPKTSVDDLAVIGEVLCQCVLYGSLTVDEWKVQAIESGIGAESLMYAAVSYWLKKPLGGNIRSEIYLFMQILQAITSSVELKDTFYWWNKVRNCIIESHNLNNALTMTVIARAVYLSTEEKVSDEDGDWEILTRESCLWAQLMSQVEVVTVLNSVLSSKPKKIATETNVPFLDYSKPDISLYNVLNKGPGYVAESVAKWISSCGFPPEWLAKATASVSEQSKTEIKSGIADGLAPDVEESDEAKTTSDYEQKLLDRLTLLRDFLPYCLATGPLLANIACEYLLVWVKSPDKTELFSSALLYLNAIESPALKLGLCSIIWNVHLKIHFENTVKLIHKIGKLPKERLCQQHLNMSDVNVKHFLHNLLQFYEIFLEVCLTPDEKYSGIRENLWTFETQPSLAEIAFAQGRPNAKILNIHKQCTTALWFMAYFPIRLHKPITNLFHSAEESQLWADIKSKANVLSPSPDPKIDEARTAFLIKVIKSAIETNISEGIPNIQEMVKWIGFCFSLADDWSLPLEPLRIQQVTLLYINNCDIYAREIVGAVNEKETLGMALLTLVGERMKAVLNGSRKDLKERMANLSPSLTTWIQEQNEAKILSDMKDISQLATLVVQILPETSPDHKFAILMAEAIEPLAD